MHDATGIVKGSSRIIADGKPMTCALYSTSMQEAKVIVRSPSAGPHPLTQVKHVRLRLRLLRQETRRELDLYIPATVSGISPYNVASVNAMFVHLTFSQKPPDEFICAIGEICGVFATSSRRKSERIPLSPENRTMLRMSSVAGKLLAPGATIPCIPLDLSFLSSRVAVKANSSLHEGGPVALVLSFHAIEEPVRIVGSILRIEAVSENSDMRSVVVVYDEKSVPIGYRAALSDYFFRRSRSSR